MTPHPCPTLLPDEIFVDTDKFPDTLQHEWGATSFRWSDTNVKYTRSSPDTITLKREVVEKVLKSAKEIIALTYNINYLSNGWEYGLSQDICNTLTAALEEKK